MKDLEEKIDEAARDYVDMRYPAPMDIFMADAFRQGAKWMSGHYIDTIWHDASEKPKEEKTLLVFFDNKYGDAYETGIYSESKGYTWKSHCKDCKIIKWC